MLHLLLSSVLAASPGPYVLPDAYAPPEHIAEASVGPLLIASIDPWVAVGGQLRGSVWLGERASLTVHTPMLAMPGEPQRGSTLPSAALLAGGAFGGRFLAVNNERFHLAPTLFVAGFGSVSSTGGAGSGLMVMAGVAMEGGWDRVRLDLSTSLAGATRAVPDFFNDPMVWYPPNALAFTEAGVSIRLNEHNDLRVGLISLVPGVRWRHEQDRWFVEAGLASAGAITLAEGQVGLSF